MAVSFHNFGPYAVWPLGSIPKRTIQLSCMVFWWSNDSTSFESRSISQHHGAELLEFCMKVWISLCQNLHDRQALIIEIVGNHPAAYDSFLQALCTPSCHLHPHPLLLRQPKKSEMTSFSPGHLQVLQGNVKRAWWGWSPLWRSKSRAQNQNLICNLSGHPPPTSTLFISFHLEVSDSQTQLNQIFWRQHF